jgi:ribosomal protein S18 acetylase RimI-like enzyme
MYKVIRIIFNELIFFKINYFKFFNIDAAAEKKNDEIVFRGVKSGEIGEVLSIYTLLNNNKKINFIRSLLYQLLGNKIILIAVKRDATMERIVGISLYYLNKRDIEGNTVHQGFIGMIPEFSNKGIGTDLGEYALKHFSKHGFLGISTRISVSNIPSIKSAEKVGFKILEKYYDHNLNEDRYYMVCNARKIK